MLNRIHQTFVSIVWTSGSLIDILHFVLICFSKRTFYTNVTDPQSFRHEPLLLLALENNWEGTGKELGRNWERTEIELERNLKQMTECLKLTFTFKISENPFHQKGL